MVGGELFFVQWEVMCGQIGQYVLKICLKMMWQYEVVMQCCVLVGQIVCGWVVLEVGDQCVDQ